MEQTVFRAGGYSRTRRGLGFPFCDDFIGFFGQVEAGTDLAK